jgi:hypothetical protein
VLKNSEKLYESSKNGKDMQISYFLSEFGMALSLQKIAFLFNTSRERVNKIQKEMREKKIIVYAR